MNTGILSEQEHELLVDVLEESLSNLLIEIAETEQWEFRRNLLDRKLSLMKLLAKIEEIPARTTRTEEKQILSPDHSSISNRYLQSKHSQPTG